MAVVLDVPNFRIFTVIRALKLCHSSACTDDPFAGFQVGMGNFTWKYIFLQNRKSDPFIVFNFIVIVHDFNEKLQSHDEP